MHIKIIVYFFLNESILWIFWRKYDFWGASLLALQWKSLWFNDNHILDSERYRRLIEKLIYLTVTRLDITFVVGGERV